MKRLILILFFLLLIAGGIAAWIFLGPATNFDEKRKALYISSKAATKQAVLDSLKKNKMLDNDAAFEFLAGQLDYWKKIRPGKYEIKKGTSLLNLVKMLRNGRQTPVDFTIKKLRTREDLARMVGRKFEMDSTQMLAFLNSSDSLSRFNTTPDLAFTNILPDTYTYFWNASPSTFYEKLYKQSQEFWTQERKNKAAALGLTPQQVYILASIIEEETTRHSEKDTIASVYLNRLRIGMPLGADPTLKFATRQFELTRIAGEILNVESPYNTYRNKGLPPGPICTPSTITIEKVLQPATTNYLYFVAKPTLGGHLFSEDFEEHKQKARDYWDADKIRRQEDSLKNARR